MRFRSRRLPSNYLARGVQLRLLGLFALLAMVMVLMRMAGREQAWHWLVGQPGAEVAAKTDTEPLDTRLPNGRSTDDPPDIVHITAPPATHSALHNTLPGIRADLLSSVRDDTEMRGGGEHQAFFHVLATLESFDEAAPSSPRPTEVGFVQLFRQPREFRGEWIRLRGVVRRAVPMSAPSNDQGIERYFQLWITPRDRPEDLVTIDVLHLPPGFPRGDKLAADVTVDGVFFKRWAYPARDVIRTAPLVLARSVAWKPPVPAVGQESSPAPWQWAAGIGTILLVIAGTAWFVGGARRAKTAPTSDELAESLSRLAELDHGPQVVWPVDPEPGAEPP